MIDYHPSAWSVCIQCGKVPPPEVMARVPAELAMYTHHFCPACSKRAREKDAVIVVECKFPDGAVLGSKGIPTGRTLPLPRVFVEAKVENPIGVDISVCLSEEDFVEACDDANRHLVQSPMARALWEASPSKN